MNIPNKVCDRLTTGMKHMRPTITDQRAKDVSEADTVKLVMDLLVAVFGFDKYADVTSEHAIRGTYCDLAVKINDKLKFLIEVKAVGISLEDRHVKQVVDYAANEGTDWVVLTNAVTWRLYYVVFAKPIDKQLIAEIDLSTIDCKDETQQQSLFLFTKEGFAHDAQDEARNLKDATSRYLLAALILKNESVLDAIRRELRRVVKVNIDEEKIAAVLNDQVIKRDALEGPEADEAARRVQRFSDRSIVAPHAKDPPPTPNPVPPSTNATGA